jgi:hypothetical protein
MEKGAGLAISPLADIPFRAVIPEIGDEPFFFEGRKGVLQSMPRKSPISDGTRPFPLGTLFAGMV